MPETRTAVRESFLQFSPPLIGEDEIEEVVSVLRSDWITTGPRVRSFEERFAKLVGADEALAFSSCTAALHTALVAMGIGEGDTVVTTPMTFCASVNVIEHARARPLLVDVEPDTLNLDPDALEEALERAPADGTAKAVMPVHLYGHPCDMDRIEELAVAHRLHVLEDAAHALPATYRGRPIGAPSERLTREGLHSVAAFSFYATKNLTTAEGGMLTGGPELLDEARLWNLHGMSRDAFRRYSAEGDWFYEVLRPGFKYNMTDLQAAIGLGQLNKLDDFQRRRRDIVERYESGLSGLEEIELPPRRDDVEHAWHLYAIRIDPERFRWSSESPEPGAARARFVHELRERNIGASVHFIPVHVHPYHRDRYGYEPQDFPVAWGAYLRTVSLPLNPRMTLDDADDVVAAVRDVILRFRA